MRVSEAVGELADRDGLAEDERAGVLICINLLQQKLGPSSAQVMRKFHWPHPWPTPLID